MRRRQLLGQHFLASEEKAALMADAAKIRGTDTVFELGTGRGMLTKMLCQRAARVVSVEADRQLASESRALLAGFENLAVVCGDGLAVPGKSAPVAGQAPGGAPAASTGGFLYAKRGKGVSAAGLLESGHTVLASTCDVFASSLPYSRSRTAVEHLASSRFGRCIIMVQKEFASKLLAGTAAEYDRRDRRAISIVAQYCFDIGVVTDVPASCFEPPPRVDSTVLRLIRKNTLGRDQICMITRMFSYRRKRISSVMRLVCGSNHTYECALSARGVENTSEKMRLDDLGAEDVVRLADCLLGAGQRQVPAC